MSGITEHFREALRESHTRVTHKYPTGHSMMDILAYAWGATLGIQVSSEEERKDSWRYTRSMYRYLSGTIKTKPWAGRYRWLRFQEHSDFLAFAAVEFAALNDID